MVQRFAFSLILLCVNPAFAATGAVGEGSGTGTPKPVAIPISTSINPSAQAGKSSQSGGASANMMAGAMLMMACMATQPPNMALCAMGAMALAQGGHDKDAADQSANTQNASALSGATGTNGSTTGPGSVADNKPTYQESADGTAGVKQAAIKAGTAALKDAGYEVTPTGVKTPGGNTIPAASFGSSGAMIAAGVDPDEAKAAAKVLEKVNSDVGKYANMGAVAEGAGGGGPGGEYQASNADESSDRKPGSMNPFALGDKARAGLMAGKTVDFDGERIGVKGENIFDMVHVVYARKTAGKHFIETDHDPDLNSRRVPASVRPPPLPKFGK